MNPQHVGLPPKFSQWRKGQEAAIRGLVFSKERFTILNIPTGSGKSASYMANALINDEDRTAIITSTRQLQTQLSEDFNSVGLEDIRGRSNYVCDIDESRNASTAKCTAGSYCDRMKTGGCAFYDQYAVVKNSRIVSTNYSFWLHAEEGGKLGQFATLILDEAHRAPEEIERFAAVEIAESELKKYAVQNPDKSIAYWGPRAVAQLATEIERKRPRPGTHISWGQADWIRGAKDLERKISRLCRLSEHEWLYSKAGRSKWRWDLLAPGQLAEDLLFRGAKKIVLSSATVNKKTISLLGIDSDKVKTIEQDSTFPVRRRPIFYWPVARVGQKMDWLAKKRITEGIDHIIGDRLDRKGIIFSVSYPRALEIVRNSKWKDDDVFVLHTKDKSLETVLAEFRRRKAGVLVSPAVTTGVDFPYCVAPTTRVLTTSLDWVTAADLGVGDGVAAFDEERIEGHRGRRWRSANVTRAERAHLPCYRLTFEDGTTVVSSADHRWLVLRGGGESAWITTKNLRCAGSYRSSIARVLPVWSRQKSFEAGYLSGIYDGEGSLYMANGHQSRGNGKTVHLSFAQNSGETLIAVKGLLDQFGYEYGEYSKSADRSCHNIGISRRSDILRFLGEFRPQRLLSKLDWSQLGQIRTQKCRLVSKEFVGVQEVVVLSTTERTFIAEGLASHNCECEFQILPKMPFPDMRDALVKAKMKRDKTYLPYITLQHVVQSVGRGMRAQDDWCESFIMDAHFDWLKAGYWEYLPRWFKVAIKTLPSREMPDRPAMKLTA